MEPQPSQQPSQTAPAKRSWRRRLLIALGVLVGLVLVLLVVVALVLQTGWAKEQVRQTAMAQIENLLADDATVTVGSIEGNLLTNAQVADLVIERDGQALVRIDSASASYNLLGLAGRRLALGTVRVVGPFVRMEQRADSSFDLAALFVADTTETDTTSSGFTITLDDLRVERGRIEVAFYTEPDTSRDSLLTADPLGVHLTDFVFAPDRLAGTLDRFAMTLTAADRTTALDLVLGGRFDDEVAVVDTLRLTSPRSAVHGHADVQYGAFLRALASEDNLQEWLPRFTADLTAQPLAMADVRAFAPVDVLGNPTLALDAESDGRNLTAVLDADLDGAGTVDLNATFRSAESGRVVYRAQGQVRALDPGRLLGNPALAATLNADLDVDLTGDATTTIDGPFSLRVFDSEMGEQTLRSSTLDGRFTNGAMRFALDAAIPGVTVTAQGTARPFATTPTYLADGRFENVNLAAFADSIEATDLSGTFSVAGQGIEVGTMQASLGATLDAATITTAATTTEIERLALDAQLVRQTLRFNAQCRFGTEGRAGGQLDLTGLVQPFAEPLVVEISEGRATELDLAALTGDPAQSSSITGTFTLDARGTEPQAMLLDLEARLDDTRYGTTAVPSADLFATLADGLLAFDGEADFADAGRMALRGETEPFADTLRYDADVLLTNLDAGAFAPPDSAGAAPLATRLNGTMRLTGRGTDPATMLLRLGGDFGESQVNDQAITSGSLIVRLTGGRLDGGASVRMPGGLVQADLTGTPFAETPAFTLRNGRFENLDVGAFAGDSTLASDLTGTFAAEVAGTDPATARAGATLTLEPSSFNDAQLDGTVALTLADGVGQADATLALAGGTAMVDATYAFPDDDAVDDDALPTFEARGDIDGVDLRPFLAPVLAALPDSVRAANPRLGQRDALSLDFDVRGSGDSAETLQASGRVWSTGARALDIRVDSLFAAFDLGDQQLDLTTLLLRSEVLDLRAGGQVALDAFTATSSLLTLTAQVKDPAPLSRLVGQALLIEEGRIEGQVQSEPGEPLEFRLDATTDLFAFGTTRASDVNTDIAGLYSADDGLAARIRFETGFLSAGTFRARDVDADARYNGEEVSLDVTLEVDDDREVRIQGRTDLDRDAPEFTLDRFDMRLGQRRFGLAQPSRISYGDRIRVRGFLLAADTPDLGIEQIAADGVIDLDGRQNFILTVEGLLLDGLTDLAGLDALGGRLDASLIMGGTASAPTLDGTFAVGPITSRKRDVGTADATFAYADQRIEVDAALMHVSGAALQATGFAPFGFALDGTVATPPSDAPVDLALTTTEPFPIAWATPFFDPRTVNELGGTLTADAAVVGTRSDPQLDGTLAILDGRMGLPEFGRVYQNATIPITLDDDRLTFGSDALGPAFLRDSDGGTLTLEGSLLVPDLQVAALDLDLLIQANRYLAIDNQTYSGFRVSASGREGLRVTGPVDGPTVTGTVQIDQGVVYQTDELIGPTFSQISLSPTDIQRVEATFGVRAAAADTTVSAVYVDTAIDLRVIVPGRVSFRADGLANIDLEFEGDLIVRKERGQEEVQLFDSIEIPRGTVEFGGRRFDVERGVFVFNGPVPETRVDLEAAMVIRQTGETSAQSALTITLNYEGTLGENPAPSFSSSPVQLETSEIVCYIATGQPCAGIVSGAGESATGLLTSQLSAAIGNVASRSLGLDLVQIEAQPDVTVTIGKYLSNRLFATLGYLVSNNSGNTDAATLDLVLQYQLRQWLQLQAEYEQLQDGENNVGGGVQFEVAY